LKRGSPLSKAKPGHGLSNSIGIGAVIAPFSLGYFCRRGVYLPAIYLRAQ
jgi:hypothetical protein